MILTNVSQSMFFKIFNLRDVNDFYVEKKIFHIQLNLKKWECEIPVHKMLRSTVDFLESLLQAVFPEYSHTPLLLLNGTAACATDEHRTETLKTNHMIKVMFKED